MRRMLQRGGSLMCHVTQRTIHMMRPEEIGSVKQAQDAVDLFLQELPAAILLALRETSASESRQHIPAKVRRAILKRDHNHCVHCHRSRSLELHHIQPVAQNGQNIVSNLVALCASCHAAVHAGLLSIEMSKGMPIVHTSSKSR
jgi:hypothetical protein